MTPEDLTDRERTVACLVASALTTKQIAGAVGIGERRVRILISAVAFKIGADAQKDERVQVAQWWAKHMRPAAQAVPIRNCVNANENRHTVCRWPRLLA